MHTFVSHTIVWTDKHDLYVRVCSTSTTVTSEHGIILMLSVNMSINSALPSVLGLESSGHCCGPNIWYLTAQQYHDFLEIVLLELLEDVTLDVRQKLWFQHNGAPTHFGEDVWHRLHAKYP
jgi:hypothetical protein